MTDIASRIKTLKAHDEGLSEDIARYVYEGRDRSTLIEQRNDVRAELRELEGKIDQTRYDALGNRSSIGIFSKPITVCPNCGNQTTDPGWHQRAYGHSALTLETP
jgi:hypothetical protein